MRTTVEHTCCKNHDAPCAIPTCKHESRCGRCCTKLIGVSVVFDGINILDDVHIHIHCGELTALVGPNGGGKTTLFKAMLGEVPHKGELKFFQSIDDSKTAHLPRLDKIRIGYVPQKLDYDLTSPISVLDLVLMSLEKWPLCFGYLPKKKERAREVLALGNVSHLVDKKLGQLSGGELQRVLLTLALSPVPNLLLLDEPFSGVDVAGTRAFYRFVSELRGRYDLSIILVSHDINSMSEIADRMIVLNHKVICDGIPKDVLANRAVREIFDFSPVKSEGASS